MADTTTNIHRLSDARRRRGAKDSGGAGAPPSVPGMLILDPRYPDVIADAFLAARYIDGNGSRRLLCHQSIFLRWEAGAYQPVTEETLAAELYAYLRPAWRPGKLGPDPFDADRRKIGDILHALRARCHLAPAITAPAWLGEAPVDLDAADILVCKNLMVHIPSLTTLPHTPDFFTHNALDYDYDQSAVCPRWLHFLRTVFPGDDQTVDQLQKIFGYVVTADTRQQKMFLLIGRPRSGKGTVVRVLTGTVGARNCVSPGLSSLATTFGLEPLLGRRLCTFSDARLSTRVDQAPIVETLLKISGEDDVTVPRKFLPAVTSKLPLRILMLANELPAFIDIAGAFVSRWIILRFTESFYGKEDPTLTETLLVERSGILNWSLQGRTALLDEAKHFTQPTGSTDLLRRWTDISSPIAAFLRDRCSTKGLTVKQLDGSEKVVLEVKQLDGSVKSVLEIVRDHLYEAWASWCADQGMGKPGTKATFGKAIVSKVIGLTEGRGRRGVDDAGDPLPRPHLYCGIRLKTEAELDQDEEAIDGPS